MITRFITATILALASFAAGCATHQGMATLDEKSATQPPAKAVYLLSVTLKNNLVPAYQPKLVSVKLQQHGVSDYPKIILIDADHLSKSESLSPTTGNSYLLRLELAPGDYTLLGINSVGQSMFIASPFFTPLAKRLTVSEPGFFYLGHIQAVIRERKGPEFHAGGMLPTQEQRLTGGFGGTFDVEITDQWNTDRAGFAKRFPVLAQVTVENKTMAAFNRDRVQAWWELNNFKEVPSP